MALTTTGFWGFVTLVDNGGQQSTLQYQLREAAYLNVPADMLAIANALAAISNSEVAAYGLSERWEEDTLILPGEVAQNENKASLTVSLVGSNKKANIKIPAPVIGMFAGTEGGAANQVNTLYAPLLTYVNYFGTGGKAYISDGEDMDVLLSGKRVHAKSNLG
jgi:hypothetical protein